MSQFQSKPVITLCNAGGSCPTLEYQEKGIEVKDDFGGRVLLTHEQWTDLMVRIDQKQFDGWGASTH